MLTMFGIDLHFIENQRASLTEKDILVRLSTPVFAFHVFRLNKGIN